MMTKKEVFDTVKTHLLTQGKRSVDDLGTCKYRGRDSTKCAVGCLIPDDKYTRSMEGVLPYYYRMNPHLASDALAEISRKVLWPALPIEYTKENAIFLHELQKIHDNNNPTLWADLLDKFALDNSLCKLT